MTTNMNEKLQRLSKKLKDQKVDTFLISNYYSIYYLSGFKGAVSEDREVYLVYSKKKLNLVAPRLYQEEAKALSSKDLKVFITSERDKLLATATDLLDAKQTVGFESEDLKYKEYEETRLLLKEKKLISLENLVLGIREIKTGEEISLIRKAQEITYKALKKVLPLIKEGITEKEISEKLRLSMLSLGAESESFGSIVAANKGSALPHYETSNKKIKNGDMILIDWGAKYKGYCGDSTRVIFLKKVPGDTVANVYNLVLKAQEKAINGLKAGMTGSEGYDMANKVFVENKVEKYFTHGLGHGIGLAVHEEPYLRKTVEKPLLEGSVFSVEPGLYFTKWGGIRIEDLVALRADKAEVLGSYPKEIVIL